MEKWERLINKIFYHVISWYEDEGKYQPTEEQARKEVEKLIQSEKKEFLKRILPDKFIIDDDDYTTNANLCSLWNGCIDKIKVKAKKEGINLDE